MPGWLTTVLLALLLSLLSYKLAVRGVATFKQESKDIAATHAAQEQACRPVTGHIYTLRHLAGKRPAVMASRHRLAVL